MRFWHRRDEPAGDPHLWLVVGLGNPGNKYARTRHNVGYMVAEALARRYSMRFSSSKQRADTARGTIEGIPVLLALPVTYMNESGNAVSRLVQYYKVNLDHLLVVCDDIDLPFGTLRLRPSGSSGGQRGLQSIVQALGTEEFARLRVGVGRPSGDATGHVLAPFPPEQERLLPQLTDTAADAVRTALLEGVQTAMNRYNRDWLSALSPTRL